MSEVTADEVKKLRHYMGAGKLVVDVCIDLQGLPAPSHAEFVWGLTKRPVDRAFTALPPLADKIGSYVARMKSLCDRLNSKGDQPLGKSLFETYPAACLELIGLKPKKYKGQAEWAGATWLGAGHESPIEQEKNDNLATMLNRLGWKSEKGTLLGHDQFDAAICALVAVATEDELVCEQQLESMICQRLLKKKAMSKPYNQSLAPPLGYRLLAKMNAKVHIIVCEGEVD